MIPCRVSLAQYNSLQFSTISEQPDITINIVFQIIQDEQGFIWFGTGNGLYRYDGYKFEAFLANPQDSNTISNSTVFALVEDNEGYLWIGTKDGLNKYDSENGEFYTYKHDENDPNSLSHNRVSSILLDSDGNIWAGTDNGLNKYNRDEDNFTVIKRTYTSLNPGNRNTVLRIAEDDYSNLWLATWNGLSIMSKNGDILKTYFTNPEDSKSFDYQRVTALYNDDLGHMYVGINGQGVRIYDQKLKKFTKSLTSTDGPNSLSDGYVISFLKDKFNNIWIGTRNGLSIYEKDKDKITKYYYNPNQRTALSGNDVNALLQDKTGLIWIGSSQGVDKYYQSFNNFNYLQKNDEVPTKGLSTNSIIGAYFDKKDDNLWLATMAGVNIISENDNSIKKLTHQPGNPNSLVDNFARSVLVDDKGIVWIGTNYSGLNKYDPVTGKFELFEYSLDSSTISSNGIVEIHQDRMGNLWFGSWYGLNKFVEETGKFKRYYSEPENSNSLVENLVWDIDDDSEGNLWIATDGGVSCFNPITENFINFDNDPTNKNFIIGNHVLSIKYTSENKIWMGTSEGISVYDKKTNEILHYDKSDGLPSSHVMAIEEDKSGAIWIATDAGLAKYDKKKEKFYSFTKKDGLKSHQFQPKFACISDEGTLYFSSAGLLSFNPDEIEPDSLAAPIVFTDLKLYNKSVIISEYDILQKPITYQEEIIIPPYNDMITIDFALLDYFNSQNNYYKYVLEGFDSQWIDAQRNNSATYTNLSPGEYKLIVKASTNNGLRNEVESSIKIIIEPRFYQTWWFLTSMGGILFLSLLVIIHLRTKSIAKHNKELEQTVRQRTKDLDNTVNELNQEIAAKDKFFSIIAHDLRSPFTSLLGFSKYLTDEAKNISKTELETISKSIYRSVRLTLDLLENLLHWARVQTGRIDYSPREINLYDTVSKCAGLLKINAENKEIELKVNINNGVTVFVDENMIDTIMRNLISNAIKFTPAGGTVKIYTTNRELQNKIEVIVEDTGVGISDENIKKMFSIGKNITTVGTQKEKGSGLGLILCKEFVEFNDGSISIESDLGRGTKVSIILPTPNNYSLRDL